MPSDPSPSWFHCGRCNALFLAQAGDLPDRRCPHCGGNPSLGLALAAPEPATPRDASSTDSQPTRHPSHHKHHKHHKASHVMAKIIAFWLLLVGLIVLGARLLWHEETILRQPAAATLSNNETGGEDLALLNEARPQCLEAFSRFLTAGSPEGRNQYVLSPLSTASRMARFYTLNPWTNLDPQTLTLETNSILNLPGGPAIEILWKSPDGGRVDTLFRKENDEWLLDWDHFARYSDYPWSLFLAGGDEPEGEFRLLARERLADTRKNAPTISLMLYAPRFGHPGDTVSQSPEFLVSRASKDGQRLDAAFKLARSGKQVFNSQLPNLNPEGMIRVRLKIQRRDSDDGRKFEIAEVLACHWYAVDEPGVTPPPASDPP